MYETFYTMSISELCNVENKSLIHVSAKFEKM